MAVAITDAAVAGEREVFSFSRLSTLLSCAQKYKLKYRDGWEERELSHNIIRGKEVEDAVYAVLGEAGAGMEMGAPAKRWNSDAILEGVRQLPQEKVALDHPIQDQYWQLGKTIVEHLLVSGWSPVLGEDGKPLVQGALRGTIGGTPFQGFYDLILRNPGGAVALVDLKVVGRKPKLPFAPHSLQLRIYDHLLAQQEPGLDEMTSETGLLFALANGKFDLICDVVPRSALSGSRAELDMEVKMAMAQLELYKKLGMFPRKILGHYDSPCQMCGMSGLCLHADGAGLRMSARVVNGIMRTVTKDAEAFW